MSVPGKGTLDHIESSDGDGDGSENPQHPPEWFTNYMAQFKRDLKSEIEDFITKVVTEAVKCSPSRGVDTDGKIKNPETDTVSGDSVTLGRSQEGHEETRDTSDSREWDCDSEFSSEDNDFIVVKLPPCFDVPSAANKTHHQSNATGGVSKGDGVNSMVTEDPNIRTTVDSSPAEEKQTRNEQREASFGDDGDADASVENDKSATKEAPSAESGRDESCGAAGTASTESGGGWFAAPAGLEVLIEFKNDFPSATTMTSEVVTKVSNVARMSAARQKKRRHAPSFRAPEFVATDDDLVEVSTREEQQRRAEDESEHAEDESERAPPSDDEDGLDDARREAERLAEQGRVAEQEHLAWLLRLHRHEFVVSRDGLVADRVTEWAEEPANAKHRKFVVSVDGMVVSLPDVEEVRSDGGEAKSMGGDEEEEAGEMDGDASEAGSSQGNANGNNTHSESNDHTYSSSHSHTWSGINQLGDYCYTAWNSVFGNENKCKSKCHRHQQNTGQNQMRFSRKPPAPPTWTPPASQAAPPPTSAPPTSGPPTSQAAPPPTSAPPTSQAAPPPTSAPPTSQEL
ncbi:PREDICTED: uncharacterized protein LOC106813295 [Priapulus caudatus]|uniref:Uncharacterized protein LOC106813295 n=1 Tax=Priapulus caudatus TaxID=37621 RepID=A0ABM1EL14_PRICU|nr:PREDICTED: uncharacterized protein LOC106813295 [Priapulus caudatus]